MKALAVTALFLVVATGAVLSADEEAKIYGRITTSQGDTFEGFIRWDKNEGTWIDRLDGTRERSSISDRADRRRKRYNNRSGTIVLFGMKISETDWSDRASSSGVRFGHIKRLEILGDDEVNVVLKSGEEIELTGGSSDIGDDMRELVIEDKAEGEVELVWDDLETVELMSAPSGAVSNSGERLYGEVETRRGEKFVGYISWDIDEIFDRDVLDGDENDRRRKIPFSRISAIERYSSSGAAVTLKSGEEIILRNSNDVDQSNNGITIGTLELGDVRVEWNEFSKVTFSRPSRLCTYGDFDGGRPLNGTVTSDGGESYSGEIKWDDDESRSWEILDGEMRGITFSIELGRVASIEKIGFRSSLVTLLSGASYRLSSSNDIDDGNKGIFITTKAGAVDEITWEDFQSVKFTQ